MLSAAMHIDSIRVSGATRRRESTVKSKPVFRCWRDANVCMYTIYVFVVSFANLNAFASVGCLHQTTSWVRHQLPPSCQQL
jgi:hypothetical protein